MRPNPRPLPFYGWLGLLSLAVVELLLFAGNDWVAAWFYPLAWWPYILLADGLVYRHRGHSRLSRQRWHFLGLIPLSVSLWLLFELFNLRLQNWHYLLVPANAASRWLGYILSYGTVLPAIFETMDLLQAYGFSRWRACRPPGWGPRWQEAFVGFGVLFLALPMAWPHYFFPLIWGWAVFLLEPLNYRLGAPSLVRDWEQGCLETTWLLFGAGAICGLLWEFWNYWAGTKWIYTVPFVGRVKLFEMPLLGFLGFPPFALECFVITSAVGALNSRLLRFLCCRPRLFQYLFWLLFLALLGAYWSLSFHLIDRHTVRSWRP